MPEEEEIFDVQAFIEAFSLERITLGAPVFDQEKLAWLNGCAASPMRPSPIGSWPGA